MCERGELYASRTIHKPGETYPMHARVDILFKGNRLTACQRSARMPETALLDV